MNPSGLNVSKDEIINYFNLLDEVYKSHLHSKKQSQKEPVKSESLSGKLKDLKKAFENGLITETEYLNKRKKIIREY